MKNIFTLLSAVLLTACVNSQTTIDMPESQTENSSYNAELAIELGADDYGMRSYVLAILKTGPNDATITDEAKRKELFAGHFSNMGRMAELGQLVLAGPLDGKMQRRGIYVFNVKTVEEAQELVKTDPSIAAGIFEVEFHKYYGSAALMKINELHEQIQKKDVG